MGDHHPVPAMHALQAPPSWRCIDFISDLHLHAGLPRTAHAFFNHLRHSRADAVFILGDLFEAWVGDDMRHEPFEAQCTAELAAAGKRLYLGLMVGNRDFLLGLDMAQACHAHLLPDPTVLEAFGQRTLLVHGDELCLADETYLRFREQVRQQGWQDAFLSRPLSERLLVARQMREESARLQGTQTPQEWADVDEPMADTWMRAARASHLVHGHTHRPQSQPFGTQGGTRHVLTDWHLDPEPDHPASASPHAGRAEVLRWDAQGWHRLPLSE